MKQKVFSKAIPKRFLSTILALAVLICSCFVITVGVTAADAEQPASGTEATDQVGCIKVKASNFSPVFGQTVYLEPETTYTFSYKYITDKADDPFIRYYTSATAGKSYTITGPVYDTYYNMVTFTFTTVALDTADIITDDTGKLIKSYVGIRSNFTSVGVSNPKYANYDFIFGDFQLLKNGEGENCFADPLMTSMQTAVNQTDMVWGAMDRTQGGQVTSNFYVRYYLTDSTYPTRDFFVSGPKDEAISVLNAATQYNGYFVQKTWLKPNTTYVFSYYYSEAIASKFVALKGTESDSGADYAFASTTATYDPLWNKVYYEFTTTDEDDAYAVIDDETGLIQAIIGIRVYSSFKAVGSYFAGFDLYEKGDLTETNLFVGTKFRSMGKMSDNAEWCEWHPNTNVTTYYQRVGYDKKLTNDMFKRSNEISIGTYDNGSVTTSATSVIEGQTVTLDVQPDEGYELLELNANGKPVPCIDGVHCFEFSNYYTDKSDGKISITATFIKKGTIPSITPNITELSRAIVQDVWLEPDTEYVFAYKYNADPASDEYVGCYTTSGEKVALSKSEKTSDDDDYMSAYRYFRTPTLLDDVVIGSDQNEGLIKCYIGFYFKPDWASTASDGISLLGAPSCYKVTDDYKTNLLTSLDFSSMDSSNEGIWHSHWSGTMPHQVCSRYDADSATDGTQAPSDESFKIDITDKVLVLTSIDTPRENPFLVQELYLKPNTTYVFSYYYSNALASSAYVGDGYTDTQFTKSAPIFDETWKKVSYEFTTTPTDVSSFDEYGRILTVVGLQFHTEVAGELLGTYFADMDLYAKDDATQTDLFRDSQYKNIGARVNNNMYHAYWENFYAIDTMAKATDVDADIFKRLKGCCNEDDTIDVLDLIRLKKRIADASTKIISANADINLDGILDALDLSALSQIILNGVE